MYQINKVRLEGIRGFNKPREITLDPKLTVIHGPNGSGKSSILQAIEWCIAGDIPYMKRGDFSKEDAIVNAFTNAGQANVELTFSGPQEVRLSRSKNRTKSTSSGKHNLYLEADRSYKDEEASSFLETAFQIDLEEFSRSKFLHQETIRDALTYSPTERSAVIEKLLGTYDIKEFTKSLDQKRTFNSEIKNLEARIESLNKDRIQLVINLRNNLDQLKFELMQKGYREEQLESSWALGQIENSRNTIDALSAKYGIGSIIHPEVTSTVESLLSSNRRIEEDTTTLDRKRMQTIQSKATKIQNLKNLIARYETALTHFKEYETLDIPSLEKKKTELNTTKTTLEKSIRSTQGILLKLPSLKAQLETAEEQHTKSREEFEELIQKYGTLETIKNNIVDYEKKVEKITNQLTQFSGQNRVVKLAADLIQSSNMDHCPVCNQSIKTQQLVNDLRSKVSEEISNQITKLEKSRDKINDLIQELKEAKSNIETREKKIKQYKTNLETVEKNLEALVGSLDDVDLDSLQQDLLSQAQENQNILNDTLTQITEVDEKIKQYNYLNQEISNSRKGLQEETGKQLEGNLLIQASSEIINEITEELKQLEDTSELDTIQTTSARLSEVLIYLRDEENTENMEKELPALNIQLEELEQRKTNLLVLEAALDSIRQAMTEYQKEESMNQIRELEEIMNDYYQAILGHPYFNCIKIDIEKEDPLQFSFRATSEREATYIPTRFSTAQLNVVALSIFMSNSKLLKGQLPLLTLDDPTQNMDDAHKKAFAELVSELTKDFQVIIATEDDETRDYIKDESLDATFYELGEWGSEGPDIIQ